MYWGEWGSTPIIPVFRRMRQGHHTPDQLGLLNDTLPQKGGRGLLERIQSMIQFCFISISVIVFTLRSFKVSLGWGGLYYKTKHCWLNRNSAENHWDLDPAMDTQNEHDVSIFFSLLIKAKRVFFTTRKPHRLYLFFFYVKYSLRWRMWTMATEMKP